MYEFYFVGCEMTTYIGKYLNPGEIHDILQNERCGRRKARLKQVREIAKKNAAKIKLSVDKERNRQYKILADRLKVEWIKENQQQIEDLGKLYGRSLQEIGEAHMRVQIEEDVIDLRAKQSEVVRQKSLLRGNEALKKFRQDREFEEEKIKHLKDMRTSVRIFEDDRARHIAALPPPKSLIIKNEQLILDSRPSQDLRPSNYVEDVSVKVTRVECKDEVDAYAAAKLEESKQSTILSQRNQEKVVHQKREQMRYLAAKTEMNLQKDYNKFLMDLEELAKQESLYHGPEFYQQDDNRNTIIQEQEALTEDVFSKLNISIITPDGSNNHREPCVSSEETVVSSSSNSTRASCENTSTPIVHLIVCDSTSNNESSHVTSGTSVVPQHSSTDSLGSSYIFQPPNISGPVTSILLMDDESSEGNSPLNGANATSVLFRPTQFKTTSMTSSDETILAGHLHREKLSATSDGAALTTESSAREESSTSQVSGTQKSIGVTPKSLHLNRELSTVKVTDKGLDQISESNIKGGLPLQEISFQGTTAEDLHTIPVNDERSPKSLEVAAERPASQDVFSGELKTMDLETENAVGLPTNKDIQTALSERSSEFFHNVEVRHINKALHDLKIKDVVPDASRNQHRISVEAGKTNPLQLFKILGQKVFGDLHSNMQATDISSQESAYSGKDYSPLVAPLRQLNSLQTLAAHTSNAPSSTKPTGGDHIFGEMTSTHRRSFQSTKGQIGFEKPFHSPELSVVLEVDTPNSSYRTSRENCSIMTTFIEAEDAFSNVESDFGKDQPGITDELDLTLVSADYSGSSNNSQIFSPSTDESLGSSRYTNELAESAKNDAFVGINVKPSTFTVQPPDSKDPSMISRVKLLNYSSVNQSFTPFSLSSFSSSRSSCSVNSKTPTLSLTDSFGSCFMNGSLKGGLRHHFTGNTDKNSIDRRLMNVAVKNSRREGDNTSSSMDFSNMVSSSLSSGFTPQSTADDKTSESLLSFVWNERLCTEDSSSSGKSTSNCRLCTSNEEQRTHSNVESFISAGQREISVCSPSDSLSESLISFLRHERSAADGSEHLSESSAYLKE